MDSNLYINSCFKGYNICLYDKNREVIFFNHHTFTTYTHSQKSQELKNFSLADTLTLIECAKTNDINSFVIEARGPLALYSLLDIKLLNTHGIDIACIKDKTPIPHNSCRPQKEEKVKRFKTTII